VAEKMPTKNNIFSTFYCLFLFEGTFTSVFIDKKSKRSDKLVEIEVFLTFLPVDGSGSVQNKEGSGSGRPKNMYGSFPTDPDPQH
jgi:hypothetical protein